MSMDALVILSVPCNHSWVLQRGGKTHLTGDRKKESKNRTCIQTAFVVSSECPEAAVLKCVWKRLFLHCFKPKRPLEPARRQLWWLANSGLVCKLNWFAILRTNSVASCEVARLDIWLIQKKNLTLSAMLLAAGWRPSKWRQVLFFFCSYLAKKSKHKLIPLARILPLLLKLKDDQGDLKKK